MSKDLYRFHCDDETLYKNDRLLSALEKVFSVAQEMTNEEYYVRPDEPVGEMVSTSMVSESPEHIFNLDGFNDLYKWISKQLMSVSSEFGIDNPTTIKIQRAWTNKLYYGCSAKWHIHWTKKKHSGVAIFYINAPENSSDFVVLQNSDNIKSAADYDDSQCDFIKVTSGDMIAHRSNLPHAVSEHKNVDPRICIVIDFYFV